MTTISPMLQKIETYILPPDEPLTLPDGLRLVAGFPAFDSWILLMGRMYGFPVYRIVALLDEKIEGVLSLIRIKHFIFGDYLATAPFASYGGFSFLSDQVRDVLLERARKLGDELDVEYVNVRFEDGEAAPPSGWIQHPVYATYRASLSSDPETLLTSYSANHRNHVRKSLKRGFTAKFGGMEMLDEAYEGLAKSMHELGSPYHSKDYLRRMVSSLGDNLELAALYNARDKLIGAGVFIFNGDLATNLHANILQEARSDYAGEFLYWSAITRYSQKGFNVFDMGRSLIGSGNEVFKMKWNPRKQILAYWYYLRKMQDVPGLNQKNPKFRIAIWIWQRLPAFIVRLFGASLIKGLA
jgi:FemAB-related protein (PEP-CTERM system-associated)